MAFPDDRLLTYAKSIAEEKKKKRVAGKIRDYVSIRCFAYKGRWWLVLKVQEGNRGVLIRFARRYWHRATG